jgi:hypothetical protein
VVLALSTVQQPDYHAYSDEVAVGGHQDGPHITGTLGKAASRLIRQAPTILQLYFCSVPGARRTLVMVWVREMMVESDGRNFAGRAMDTAREKPKRFFSYRWHWWQYVI